MGYEAANLIQMLQSQDLVNMAVDVEFHRKEEFVDRRVSVHSQKAEVVYTCTMYLDVML
jgi:hypothetical protein